MKNLIVIVVLMTTTILTNSTYCNWSKPKTIIGFKHISSTHKPNCNCVVTFNGKLMTYVIEADAEAGFVKIQLPDMKKAVTVYGDVQIYPVKIKDGYIYVMSKYEIRVLKRKFFLQGF